MNHRSAYRLLAGSAAGFGASLIQAAVGKIEDRMFLPRHENADIAPRLMHRGAAQLGLSLPEPLKWTLGTAFHLGYGAAWGAAYGLSPAPRKVPPLVAGAALGTLIYAITFPKWGLAVQSGTERRPGRRTLRMEAVAWSVTLSFGVATALLYDWLHPKDEPVGKVLPDPNPEPLSAPFTEPAPAPAPQPD